MYGWRYFHVGAGNLQLHLFTLLKILCFSVLFYNSRAKTSPQTLAAPADLSTPAQASRVAPDVDTSSISNTCFPRKRSSTQAKASATFSRRSVTLDVLACAG